MYDPDDPAVEGLLKDMASLPFAELGKINKQTHVGWHSAYLG